MGETFGRYELLRRIGVGGMAEVFIAKTYGAEGFVKEVVIKRILPAFSEDPDFVRMFINEARLAALLQHPNIVQIFDFNNVNEIFYIAMEWVDGQDLKKIFNAARRRQMPIPLSGVVHIGVETLKGLYYAHTKTEQGRPLKIVHRDISPHNLLVSFAGGVKIADFGIAKVSAVASATRSGMVKGKLGYMSPEQASSRTIDARSDLFSLGIVLWELLAGRRLYQGENEAELFAQAQKAIIPSVREFNSLVPAELASILERMLRVDPEERYSTAAHALSELSKFAHVGDELEVATFLKDLLPSEGTREKSSETAVMPAAPAIIVPFRTAPADLPTRSLSAKEQGVSVLPSTAGESWAARQSASFEAETKLWDSNEYPQSAAVIFTTFRTRALKALFLISMATILSASGFIGGRHFWTRYLTKMEQLKVASIELTSKGTARPIMVEGVPVGQTPLIIRGPVNQEVHVQSVEGEPVISSQLHFGEIFKWTVPGSKLTKAKHLEVSAQTQPTSFSTKQVVLADQKVVAVTKEKGRGGENKITNTDSTADSNPARSKHRPIIYIDGNTLLKPATGTEVMVAPWAYVRIDGKEWGQTPVRNLPLSEGEHSIEIKNSELSRHEIIRFRIRPGLQVQIKRDWTK